MTNTPEGGIIYVQGNRYGENRKEHRAAPGRARAHRQGRSEVSCLQNAARVYFWIAGKNLPSIDNLFMLAEMLQVSIDEILIAKDEYRQQRSVNENDRDT